MLKVFRDNLKYLSWVLWLVIAVFILFVFVDFGATVPGGTVSSDAAATLGGGDSISFAEFERAYRQREDFYRQQFGDQFSSELARQIGLPGQVMDELVADRILLAEAERIGVRVTDREVRDAILAQPVFTDELGNFIGQDAYEQILRRNRLNADDFEASIRQDLLANKVRSILSQNVYVADSELEERYRQRIETATIRFLKLPAERFGGETDFEDDEIQTYFAEYGESFRVPERRSVNYLLVDRAEIEGALTVSDVEVERYYEENAEEFTRQEEVRARHILLRVNEDRSAEEAREQMAAIRRRIEGGESFEAVAREVSDDPGSREQGGDLGFFGRGQMVGPFEEAAFGAQPGELVGPVETNFGLHLIEVLERQQAGRQPLEEVAGTIRSRLLGDRSATEAEIKARELGERIRNEGLADAEALRAVADAESGVSMLSTPPFSREDSIPGIGRMPAFADAAFELEEGAVSEPVRIPRGWAILHLAGVEPSRLPAIEEVTAEIVEALRVDKEMKLALQRLAEAREELAAGKTFDQLAADLDVEIEEAGPFGADGSVGSLGAKPAIVEAALKLEEGDIGGPVTDEREAILFEVTARSRFDPVAFEAEKPDIRAELANERYVQMLTSLVNARREDLDIRYHRNFIENFDIDRDGVGS